VLSVADDGVGGAAPGGGSGLLGLGDRLAALDGTLTIDSAPDSGTRLVARLPIVTAAPC
jgi:signal transduction histidine kinase